jgi:ABC-type branched-subunit amino acid transport system substrate-binding protein
MSCPRRAADRLQVTGLGAAVPAGASDPLQPAAFLFRPRPPHYLAANSVRPRAREAARRSRVKQLRWIFLSVGLVTAACAPAMEAPEPPRPETPVERPPEPPAREAPLRVGLIATSSGSAVLQQFGQLVLDGAQVAAAERSTARRAVELVIRDDGGTAAGAARAVRELEQAGVTVIVGPLVDDALAAAAAARTNPSTLLVSPTSVSQPAQRNAYALNVVDARGGAALGEHARRFARVGVLYPRTPEHTPQARAFAEAYRAGGRGTVTEAAFDPGATNVATQLMQLRNARVEAVFLPGTERHLQLVLPQLDYFGLGAVQLLGNESWLSDSMRGTLARMMNGAVVATPLFQESADIAWKDFVRLYESRFRRTLDSPIPALGYDAVQLAVRAAGGSITGEYRGATGVMQVQAESITRRPFLVRIQDGRLILVN